MLNLKGISKTELARKLAVAIAVAIALVSVAVIANLGKQSSGLTIGGDEFSIEIASSPSQRSLGLSGRESLGTKDGLLFVFQKDGMHEFWMKDMKFSIDMIWLDSNGVIVHIEPSVSPSTFPELFSSQSPARYVLEVNAGVAEQYHLQLGDNLDIDSVL